MLAKPGNTQSPETQKTDIQKEAQLTFSYAKTKILQEHFLKFAPNGKPLEWSAGFVERCQSRKLDPIEKATIFVELVQYISSMKNECWLLDVSNDFHERIEWSAIDELYFADQYKWMEFGRGKIAELTYYGKDTQNKKLIDTSIALVVDQLQCLIRTSGIDAIAFTPHSKIRQIQLLKELKKKLDIHALKEIWLVKYAPYGTMIAQKSLKTRAQRIQNARETILLSRESDVSDCNKILLIDDFVWSWATLNETAKKLKAAWADMVIAFAFVGNANLQYDVIREI